jgi:23S rRNA pseudouridine1911/1915/1917 synthase
MIFSAEELHDHRDVRLDVFLTSALGRSRAFVQGLIEGGQVVLAPYPEKVKPGYRIHKGDSITVSDEPLQPAPEPNAPQGEAIPLQVLYEDDQLMAVNKPPGLVVHPAVGHLTGTLVNALVHHCGDAKALTARAGAFRLGIVHRLDKDTSGVIVVAKTDLAHERLGEQFAGREVYKVYQALCWGEFRRPSGICGGAIARHRTHRQRMAIVSRGGRHARTDYKVLKQGQHGAWVECVLHTGRTHQIRVHLSALGHPVAGDITYGRTKRPWGGLPVPRQMLHAAFLRITHPITGKEIEFTAPLPKDFQALLDRMEEKQKVVVKVKK